VRVLTASVKSGPRHAVRCLKRDGRRGIWLVQRAGHRAVTVKQWPLTFSMVAKLGLGIAQPQRQRRGARRLTRAGVRTPSPRGPIRLRGRPRRVEVEHEYVEGRTALELLREEPDPIDRAHRRALVRVVGAAVANIASAGLLHRDVKLTNLVIDDHDPPRVWFIDPVGVRRAVDPVARFVRMFDRLAVEPTNQGIDLPAWQWQPLVRAALAGVPRPMRRAIITRIRSYVREHYAPPGT